MIKKGYVQDKLLKTAYAAHGAAPYGTATHATLTALLAVSAEDAEMTEEMPAGPTLASSSSLTPHRFLLASTTTRFHHGSSTCQSSTACTQQRAALEQDMAVAARYWPSDSASDWPH